jgi:hypothetical protein
MMTDRGQELLSSLKKKGCKCFVGLGDLRRRGVFQLNGGGYNPKGGQICYIHSLKRAYSISQNCQRKS